MSQQRGNRRNYSNRELFEHVDLALDCFDKSLARLERQQKELAGRIQYIAPTPSEMKREVEEFIERSLGNGSPAA